MFHVKQQGGKRVGFAHCTLLGAGFCTGPLPAARTYAKSLNLGIGRDLALELAGDDANYRAKVQSYFEAEQQRAASIPGYEMVDWLWAGNSTRTVILLAKELAAVKADLEGNGKPPIPKVQIIVNNYGFDERVFANCGAPCTEVIHGLMPFTAYGDVTRGSTEMANVTTLHDKWRAREVAAAIADAGSSDAGDGGAIVAANYRNVRYVQGYVAAMMYRVAAERAIASGKQITGETIKESLETFRRMDTGGLSDRLTFTATDHRPQANESIYKFDKDGVLVYEPPDRNVVLEQTWLGW